MADTRCPHCGGQIDHPSGKMCSACDALFNPESAPVFVPPQSASLNPRPTGQGSPPALEKMNPGTRIVLSTILIFFSVLLVVCPAVFLFNKFRPPTRAERVRIAFLDQNYASLIAEDTSCEARGWVQEDPEWRFIGYPAPMHFKINGDSLVELIDSLYAHGAACVTAINIERTLSQSIPAHEQENADALILTLPDDRGARQRLLRFVVETQNHKFLITRGSEKDRGQHYIALIWRG